MKENEQIKYNLIKFKEDFAENIHSVNENEIENVLFEVSKELSSNKGRKQLILAHFLADIACIDLMYVKFLGKKRLDILNHPYFKKLNEISIDKLYENLENKYKLYEYHRNE